MGKEDEEKIKKQMGENARTALQIIQRNKEKKNNEKSSNKPSRKNQ